MNSLTRPCQLAGSQAVTKALRCPSRKPHLSRAHTYTKAQRTSAEYSELLRSTDDDWTKTLELVTEVNVLKIEVEPQALECAVASFARGGQWQRAESLYRQLQAQGHTPSDATTTQLVAGMASSAQGERAAQLLAEMSSQDMRSLSSAYNLAVRALARQGLLDESYELLRRIMKAEVRVDASTFTSLATCCMNAERVEMAEEVLEMRDYL